MAFELGWEENGHRNAKTRSKHVVVDESLEVAQLPCPLDGALMPVQVTQVKEVSIFWTF